MSHATTSSAAAPTQVRWIIFSLGCGTSWLLYLHRYAFALMKPALEKEWGLNNTELGMLDLAFGVPYTFVQFPGGILADLIGPHLFLGASIIAWSISFGASAWVATNTGMWYARAGCGAAQAGVYAALSRSTRTWFPSSIRTTVQGWIGVFFGRIGGASANVIFPLILLISPGMTWRDATNWLTGFGVAFGLLFIWLYRNSPREHSWVNPAEAALIEERDGSCPASSSAAPRWREFLAGLTLPGMFNLGCLMAQTTLSTLADSIYSTWIPKFLFDVHHLNYTQMGLLSALPLIGGGCGGAVGGWVADRLAISIGSRRWSRVLVGLLGKGLAGAILFVALLWYDSPYVFCSLLVPVKFFADWGLSVTWGTVTDIGGSASATVFGLNNMVGSTAAFIGPPFFGYVAQHYGWLPVFVIIGATYLLCALSWLAINCERPLVQTSSRIQN